jgi:hypothetical protein
MNRGVKNSPETVKAGSLMLHPNKRGGSSSLRTLVKFTNSPINQEIYWLVADFSWLLLVGVKHVWCLGARHKNLSALTVC